MNDMNTVWQLNEAMARRFPTQTHPSASTVRRPRRRPRWLGGKTL
jgi:hypothetical protein